MSVDHEKMEVTVRAGTTLSELNVLLEEYGLAMRILGSISDQTVAGAISTGKYGNNYITSWPKKNLLDKKKFAQPTYLPLHYRNTMWYKFSPMQ